MKIRVFYPNKDNKIAFTKEQLEKLLSEVYDEGHADGYNKGWASTHPVGTTYPYTPYRDTSTGTGTTKEFTTITYNGGEYATSSTTTATSGCMTLDNISADGGIIIGDEK